MRSLNAMIVVLMALMLGIANDSYLKGDVNRSPVDLVISRYGTWIATASGVKLCLTRLCPLISAYLRTEFWESPFFGIEARMPRHGMTDAEWELIADLFPEPVTTGRSPRKPRELLNAILWVVRTSASWRDVPKEFVPWKTSINFRGIINIAIIRRYFKIATS
jgi:hypothetical protein